MDAKKRWLRLDRKILETDIDKRLIQFNSEIMLNLVMNIKFI